MLRVDHSGWPFRADVAPFTSSLLAYPVVLFALLRPVRWFWLRWALLAAAAAETVLGHVAVGSPAVQYGMWAEGRSIDPHVAGIHNLPGIRSPLLLGAVSVAIGMALNMTAVLAVVAMLAAGLRRPR